MFTLNRMVYSALCLHKWQHLGFPLSMEWSRDVWQVLGPLQTQAKTRDHEIVRTQKRVSKGCPNTPPKSCRVVTALKWSVKSCVVGPSTKCYLNVFLFVRALHMINRINQWLWDFGVPWSLGFVSGLPPKGGFENSPSDHDTQSIWCHVGVHGRLYICLSFRSSVGPSSIVWSELGLALPIPPTRVLEMQWSRA